MTSFRDQRREARYRAAGRIPHIKLFEAPSRTCAARALGIGEPLGLQLEHRPVAAAARDQLVVAAELDDPPCSSTQIRSAWRTVENRCETRIVIRPAASPRAVRAVRAETA